MRATFLHRLDARDRALFGRWVIGELTPARATRAWRALTHLGGATATIVAVLGPAALGGPAWRAGSLMAGAALLLSHLAVQLVKRRVLRERPTVRVIEQAHVAVPDRFSFPSGHSAAAMSIGFGYGMMVPEAAAPLIVLASLIGFSRVRLGVHYPGDVIVGQALAVLTVLGLLAASFAR